MTPNDKLIEGLVRDWRFRNEVWQFERSRCECDKWLACGGTFTCGTCRREVGWCMGGPDERPDDCSGCWLKWHEANPEDVPVRLRKGPRK